MPELPEVETVMRGLECAVTGKSIKHIQINRYDLRVPIPEDFGQRLTGLSVSSFTRRGKYIAMGMTDPQGPAAHVIVHLGMSGRIRIFDSANAYEPRKHDHIIMHMDGGGCFAYEDPRRFGMVYLSAGADWEGEKPFALMGPEPLGAWSGADLHQKLSGKKTNIKAALLDQRVVAGLGNIYVCEALYDSGIHPQRACETLSLQEANDLVEASKVVLLKAIKAGGSTLKDYQHTDGSLGYFQHQFSVYDQEGQPCKKKGCGGTIERIVQSGRSTFYCSVCQK